MASVEELSRKYSSQLSQLRAIFPTWDESDLAFTLQDTKGNVEEAVMAITEGRASQFTQATRKKPVKAVQTQGKGHTNRNADTGGWENVNGDGFSGARGGRGGARGGRGGGRGGRGGEPTRGGRGGRGGIRGGRGGLVNANGAHKKANGFPTSTDTSPEGWANQVAQSNAAEAATDDGGWSTAADAASTVKADADSDSAPVETSQAEDFAAAGGLGDAPAPKEVVAAAKQGGTGWQEDIKKPVQTAASAKPKLTWAQIAKPVEKPKPAPPPAPKAEPPAPITTEEPTTEASAPAEDEAEVEASVEEEIAPEVVEDAVEPETTEKQPEDEIPEEPPLEQVQQSAWEEDPAIAGSGAQPSIAQAPQPAAAAPEPVTTYTGPPGLNTVAARAAAASQPRTASRAGRYKNADDQGVVLPAAASGVSAMEMQFGSLSFGGQAGDGVEAPVPEPQDSPVQPIAAPPPPAVTSPIRAPQPTQASQLPSAAAQPAIAPAPAQPPSSSHPFYSQQATQPPAQTQAYQAHQQPQQQQAPGYGSQYGQQPQAQSQDPFGQSAFYRSQQDYSSAFGAQAHQPQQAQQQQQQQQQAHSEQQAPSSQQQHQQQAPQQPQQHTASPYDGGFGGFGGSQLFGQPQQHSQHQATDAFGGAQRQAYDSYSASGYPRPPVEESKQSAPAPSHTGSAPGQPQQNLHQQNQYYSQLGNMGYYQAAPYNPYYQYGQAPTPGFQQYYPLAGRAGGIYGQPNPQAPPAPIQQATKPSPAPAHSPYGGPSPYPSSTYDDQSSLGRYGDSKAQTQQPPQQQQQAPQSYQSPASGLHNFLGAHTATAGARPQASTPEESFKSQGTQSQGSVQGQNRSAPLQQATAGSNGQQQQHGGFNYPYGVGGYGNQDWSQYGQHYGSRNGYSHWQQQ